MKIIDGQLVAFEAPILLAGIIKRCQTYRAVGAEYKPKIRQFVSARSQKPYVHRLCVHVAFFIISNDPAMTVTRLHLFAAAFNRRYQLYPIYQGKAAGG